MRYFRLYAGLFAFTVLSGCGSRTSEGTDSHTHWFTCERDDDCDEEQVCSDNVCEQAGDASTSVATPPESDASSVVTPPSDTEADNDQTSNALPSGLATLSGPLPLASSAPPLVDEVISGTLPPLVEDCSAEKLYARGHTLGFIGYTWDGTRCSAYLDDQGSSNYVTQAECEIAHVACMSSVPSEVSSPLGSHSRLSFTVLNSLVDTQDFSYWTEAEWLGWQEPEETNEDCPEDNPPGAVCLSRRVLQLLVGEEVLEIEVTLPWGRALSEYAAPGSVLFQFTGAPEPEELQVTDATDGSVVFWVKNEGFAEQAWMLDDLQVRVGSPIAKTLSLFCNNVIAYTPTLVGFIPPNSSGLIPYQLTDETELAPFSSAVLTNPSGQRSYEVNVGVGEHNVRAYPGPRCPNSLFHGQSFAFHRLQ